MHGSILEIYERPKLKDARLLIGFTGWMDGGDVSTGTIDYLVDKLDAAEVAEIASEDFYIYNFPGPMEVSSLFRPHCVVEEGVVVDYEEPVNRFYCSEEHNLLLFEGKEPNMGWPEYAECIFEVIAMFDVKSVCFIGSVAGAVPHTRETLFHGSVSDERFLPLLAQHNVQPSNYEGPASFVTYLMVLANERNVRMSTVVAEIPAYVDGPNVKCIEAATRKVAEVLELAIDVDELRAQSKAFDRKLRRFVKTRPDLADLIRRMETDYDKAARENQIDQTREWFEKQDISLDIE